MPGDCLAKIQPYKCITLNKCVLLSNIAFHISSKINGIMHFFGCKFSKTIVDHWCLKSENHRKTIESNGLGAENH